VAVTGATGLVGNNVVRYFLDLGYDIRAVVHPEEGLQSLDGLNVQVARADITKPEQIREALKGAEAVVHAAGLVSITEASKGKLETVNVQGTKNVIEACKANGVKKLIYISSVHALPADGEGPIKETKELSVGRVQGAYAKSKVEATLLTFQANEEGLCTVVLHPTGIVGPYDFRTSIVDKLVINALSGKLKWYVSGGYDFVDARDVAQAAYLALEKGRCGENYIVAGEYITMRDFLWQCFEVAGKPFNLREIPYNFALAISPFFEWCDVRNGLEPQMSLYALKTLRSKSNIDSSKIRQELGFVAMPIEETVKDLTEWYLERMGKAELKR
jgi:dihydroflavonol-4-reductase